MLGFAFKDEAREFPEKNRVLLARILADMVDNGMLFKNTSGNIWINQLEKAMVSDLERTTEHPALLLHENKIMGHPKT